MALGATIHHFAVQLSDADRSVYEALEFKAARHPSETAEALVATATWRSCKAEERRAARSAGRKGESHGTVRTSGWRAAFIPACRPGGGRRQPHVF